VEVETEGSWFETSLGKSYQNPISGKSYQNPVLKSDWVWWYIPIISATQEAEGLWSKASLGKFSTRPYLKNTLKKQRLEA
jgi:hypothetical protein